MAKPNIRKFRHEVALLKLKGLVEGVDARSVQPTSHLRGLIERFDDVLSGKATPVKLSKTETKNLKAAGYDVYKGRTIFPHSAGEKITVTHGHGVIRQPSGVERVQIPIAYHDLESYLRSLKKHDKDIDAMKRRDEYFAFRFYGHQSNAVYRNIDLLLEDLTRYEAIENAKNSRSAKDMNEVYRNLEIVKVHRSHDWGNEAQRIRTERGKYSPTAYKKAKAKRKRNPAKAEAYNLANAQKQQAHRDSLNQAEKAKYRAAARKRAKKSRRKHAKKKGGKHDSGL